MSAILRIPLTLPELHDFALTSLTQSQILILVYYGVGPVVCFLFYGIWRISASTAGMTVVPVPVASVLTSALFFDAAITSTDLAAACLIVASIVIAEMKFRRRATVATVRS